MVPLPRRVVIASDHAGVEMKRRLREAMKALGISAEDLGTGSGESVDYPDYAAAVARRISTGTARRPMPTMSRPRPPAARGRCAR